MFKRLGVLILAAMLCLTGCEKTETAANQFPDAPWGASIEEISKHYDLTYVEWTAEELSAPHGEQLRFQRLYTAQKKMFGYDVSLKFNFFCIPNENGEYNSYLGTASAEIKGVDAKQALKLYEHKEGSLLKKFGYVPVEDIYEVTDTQLANYEHNRSLCPYIGFSEPCNTSYYTCHVDTKSYTETYTVTIFNLTHSVFTEVRMEIPE